MWQAHYEELKVARDSAEHQSDETGRQLSRAEKQLKESQDALSNSSHEVSLNPTMATIALSVCLIPFLTEMPLCKARLMSQSNFCLT